MRSWVQRGEQQSSGKSAAPNGVTSFNGTEKAHGDVQPSPKSDFTNSLSVVNKHKPMFPGNGGVVLTKPMAEDTRIYGKI